MQGNETFRLSLVYSVTVPAVGAHAHMRPLEPACIRADVGIRLYGLLLNQ